MDRAGLKRSGELERVELLARVLRRPGTAGVALGIGDDAAVLEPGTDLLVWTVDVQVEHVHFERGWLGWDELGYRATMAAASDLAAMAARPRGVLASLVLPAEIADAELGALCAGQARACDELGTALVGGNLARGGELSITTTVLGAALKPLCRAGARPGDQVALAGPVGLAGAGLGLLQRGLAHGSPRSAAHAAALHAWRSPVARIAEGLRVAELGSSAIDLSDGLGCDAARIVRASAAAGAPVCMVLEAEPLLGPELRALGAELGASPIELALRGGEDYALLVTLPPGQLPDGFVHVGCCEPLGADGAPLVLCDTDGTRVPVSARGFDHFG